MARLNPCVTRLRCTPCSNVTFKTHPPLRVIVVEEMDVESNISGQSAVEPIYERTRCFSSPVQKYRKSYCSHPGIGLAQMLKFLDKIFINLDIYLLNMLMDQLDT